MFTDPTFWVAIAFVVFVILVYRPIKKSMTQALDSRAEAIRAELDTAQALREEAQKSLADYKRRQHEAVNEANEIIERAKRDAQALREQAEKDPEQQLERRQQLALQKIEQAEATAIKQIRDQAVDLAMAATRRLLVEQIDERKSDELVGHAIKDLPARLS